MVIIDELNDYFGMESSSIEEFEKEFKDKYYSHDYVESLFKFMKYLNTKKI